MTNDGTLRRVLIRLRKTYEPFILQTHSVYKKTH
jgi:hypothetical protein